MGSCGLVDDDVGARFLSRGIRLGPAVTAFLTRPGSAQRGLSVLFKFSAAIFSTIRTWTIICLLSSSPLRVEKRPNKTRYIKKLIHGKLLDATGSATNLKVLRPVAGKLCSDAIIDYGHRVAFPKTWWAWQPDLGCRKKSNKVL